MVRDFRFDRISSPYRLLATVLVSSIAFVCASGLLYKVFMIVTGRSSATTVQEVPGWGELPDFWFCPYSDFDNVTFAFQNTWTAEGGLTYSDGSEPLRHDPVYVDVRRQHDRDVGETWFSQHRQVCAFVNSSVLVPRSNALAVKDYGANILEIWLSFEYNTVNKDVNWNNDSWTQWYGFKGLSVFAQMPSKYSVPPWARSNTQSYLFTVNGYRINGDYELLNEVRLVKSESGWEYFFSTESVAAYEPSFINTMRVENPDVPLSKVIRNGSDFNVSTISDPNDPTLWCVYVEFSMAKPTVTKILRQSVFLQLMRLTANFGGFYTVVGVVMTTIFVKKYPNSRIAQVYDSRTLIGSELAEHLEPEPELTELGESSDEVSCGIR